MFLTLSYRHRPTQCQTLLGSSIRHSGSSALLLSHLFLPLVFQPPRLLAIPRLLAGQLSVAYLRHHAVQLAGLLALLVLGLPSPKRLRHRASRNADTVCRLEPW